MPQRPPTTTTIEVNSLHVYAISRSLQLMFNLIEMGLVPGDTYDISLIQVGAMQMFEKLEEATLDLATQHRKEKL